MLSLKSRCCRRIFTTFLPLLRVHFVFFHNWITTYRRRRFTRKLSGDRKNAFVNFERAQRRDIPYNFTARRHALVFLATVAFISRVILWVFHTETGAADDIGRYTYISGSGDENLHFWAEARGNYVANVSARSILSSRIVVFIIIVVAFCCYHCYRNGCHRRPRDSKTKKQTNN